MPILPSHRRSFDDAVYASDSEWDNTGRPNYHRGFYFSWVSTGHNDTDLDSSLYEGSDDEYFDEDPEDDEPGNEQVFPGSPDRREQEDLGTSGFDESGNREDANEEELNSDPLPFPVPGWTQSHPSPSERLELQRRGEEAQESRNRSRQHSVRSILSEEAQ